MWRGVWADQDGTLLGGWRGGEFFPGRDAAGSVLPQLAGTPQPTQLLEDQAPESEDGEPARPASQPLIAVQSGTASCASRRRPLPQRPVLVLPVLVPSRSRPRRPSLSPLRGWHRRGMQLQWRRPPWTRQHRRYRGLVRCVRRRPRRRRLRRRRRRRRRRKLRRWRRRRLRRRHRRRHRRKRRHRMRRRRYWKRCWRHRKGRRREGATMAHPHKFVCYPS
jgi:hypothetical protein